MLPVCHQQWNRLAELLSSHSESLSPCWKQLLTRQCTFNEEWQRTRVGDAERMTKSLENLATVGQACHSMRQVVGSFGTERLGAYEPHVRSTVAVLWEAMRTGSLGREHLEPVLRVSASLGLDGRAPVEGGDAQPGPSAELRSLLEVAQKFVDVCEQLGLSRPEGNFADVLVNPHRWGAEESLRCRQWISRQRGLIDPVVKETLDEWLWSSPGFPNGEAEFKQSVGHLASASNDVEWIERVTRSLQFAELMHGSDQRQYAQQWQRAVGGTHEVSGSIEKVLFPANSNLHVNIRRASQQRKEAATRRAAQAAREREILAKMHELGQQFGALRELRSIDADLQAAFDEMRGAADRRSADLEKVVAEFESRLSALLEQTQRESNAWAEHLSHLRQVAASLASTPPSSSAAAAIAVRALVLLDGLQELSPAEPMSRHQVDAAQEMLGRALAHETRVLGREIHALELRLRSVNLAAAEADTRRTALEAATQGHLPDGLERLLWARGALHTLATNAGALQRGATCS